jgi:hypothetical protein
LQKFRSFVHSLNKMGRCLGGGSKRIELVKLALRFSGRGSAALNISIWRNTHQEPQTRRAILFPPSLLQCVSAQYRAHASITAYKAIAYKSETKRKAEFKFRFVF